MINDQQRLNSSAELLNYVYQNAKMGKDGVSQIIPKVEDQALQETLLDQLSEYQDIVNKSAQMLNNLNIEPKESMMDKVSSKTAIAFSTLTDHSTSHIAEIMINGSTMGIIDITRRINQFPDCQKDVCNLCQQLVQLEEGNVDRLKQFL